MDRGGPAVIRVRPRPEPANFDRRCRKRGRQWLKTHPDYQGRPRDYWSEFEPDLREAFEGRCGYCAMRVMKGQVDHFVPVAMFRAEANYHLAYEWSNFRYGEGTLNQRKAAARVLDPFEVEDDWFQILLPSLQLVLTDKVPKDIRPLAEFTLERLGLRDHEVVVRFRREWFRMYQEGHLSLDGLRKVAPLVARAVEHGLEKGRDWRLPPSPTRSGSRRTQARGSETKGRKEGQRRGKS
jgi:hypothetical protein